MSLMRSGKRNGLFNFNVLISITGIAVGVMFLILTVSIYDGYVGKIETISFSLNPQITLKSYESREDDDDYQFNSLFDDIHDDDCAEICKGDGMVILKDKGTDTDPYQSPESLFDLQSIDQIIDRLKPVTGISRISPLIFKDADFRYVYSDRLQEKVTGTTKLRILGVHMDREGPFVPEIGRIIPDAAVLERLKKTDSHRVIVSAELYRNIFGSEPSGSGFTRRLRIELLHPKKSGDAEGAAADSIELEVIGVFKLGISSISRNMIITSIPTAQKLLGIEGYATFIGCSLDEPYTAGTVADKIKKILRQDKIIVLHWLIVMEDLFNSLTFYRKLIIIVLLMSIIITAFNIHNNLSVMILERRKQIGILNSMGMTKGSITKIFLIISQIEAFIGSVVGIFAGILAGYGLNHYINAALRDFLPIEQAQIAVKIDILIGVFAFVCVTCALTSLFSSAKANRLDTIECLQWE